MHHIHVWEMDEQKRALEAHIVLDAPLELTEVQPLKARLKQHLQDVYAIGHSTLEFEPPDTSCSSRDC